MCLWSHLGRMTRDKSNPTQFQLGLASDCMRFVFCCLELSIVRWMTLSHRFFVFETRNKYSKRWALVTATLLLESVLVQAKRIHDVSPDWVPVNNPAVKGKLVRGM